MRHMIRFKKEFKPRGYTLEDARVVDRRQANRNDWRKLKDYWMEKHGIELPFFAEVVSIKFKGLKTKYDFPSVVFENGGEDLPEWQP